MTEPKNSFGHASDKFIEERLDDLAIYIRLLKLAQELDWLSKRCWSVTSQTALGALALLVRTTASGVYSASLRD